MKKFLTSTALVAALALPATAFADGHSEIKKWVDNRTVEAPNYGQTIPLNVASPNNPDVLWMSQRTSALKPGKTR